MCGVGRLRIGSGQLHASTQSFPEPCILEARDPQASGSAQAKSSSLAQASFLQLMGQSRRMFLFSRSLFAPLPPGVLPIRRFSPLIFQPASRSKHTVFFHLICFFSSAEPAILPSLPWPEHAILVSLAPPPATTRSAAPLRTVRRAC